MDLKIGNKRALVMGASSGLGQAIAYSLIQEGVQVAICSRNEPNLMKTAAELGAQLAVPCDLNQPGAATELIKTVIAKLGGIDILVCNTGGPPSGTFDKITDAQWQSGFQSLWMSTVDSIQGVLPDMKARKWGRILLVTSVAAKEPMPALTVSNGLRAGLSGLTKSLSNEIAMYGITINSILPGYTRTDRLKQLGVPEEKIAAMVPAGRMGEPAEFAALATFLASEQAAYISGQAIACDGGYMKGI
jgi:3-oxoacyl-[acyl-carrier protein] reductase